MKLFHNTAIILILVIFFLMGCVASETSGPSAPSTTTNEQVSSAEATVDHRPTRDTVNWQSTGVDNQALWSDPVDREWPGEELGLIGPIIARGGSGSKAYVAIYDPGGVFIGALYLKEAREDPTRLENLLRLAAARGVIQNNRTLDLVSARRFLDMAIAARKEVKQ